MSDVAAEEVFQTGKDHILTIIIVLIFYSYISAPNVVSVVDWVILRGNSDVEALPLRSRVNYEREIERGNWVKRRMYLTYVPRCIRSAEGNNAYEDMENTQGISRLWEDIYSSLLVL